MRRGGLGLCAAACLALAVVLAPDPPPAGRGLLGSIGASMGGLRVMVINALFLRAEAQKKAGRIDDAAALYETVLELDPANEAGTIYLVNTIVDELMPQAPTLDERFGWWQRAYDLLVRALERRPRSGPLRTRAGTLLLDAGYVDPAIRDRLADAVGLPRLVALRHLRVAMQQTETLPRQGRGHLLRIALQVPLVAADMLADDAPDPYREVMAIGAETVDRRGDVLAEMRIDETTTVDLRQVLEARMQAVAAVAAVLRGSGDRAGAERRIAGFRALVPDEALTDRLRALLDK